MPNSNETDGLGPMSSVSWNPVWIKTVPSFSIRLCLNFF